MEPVDYESVADLLRQADLSYSPSEFRRIASARTLYHWHTELADRY